MIFLAKVNFKLKERNKHIISKKIRGTNKKIKTKNYKTNRHINKMIIQINRIFKGIRLIQVLNQNKKIFLIILQKEDIQNNRKVRK